MQDEICVVLGVTCYSLVQVEEPIEPTLKQPKIPQNIAYESQKAQLITKHT